MRGELGESNSKGDLTSAAIDDSLEGVIPHAPNSYPNGYRSLQT